MFVTPEVSLTHRLHPYDHARVLSWDGAAGRGQSSSFSVGLVAGRTVSPELSALERRSLFLLNFSWGAKGVESSRSRLIGKMSVASPGGNTPTPRCPTSGNAPSTGGPTRPGATTPRCKTPTPTCKRLSNGPCKRPTCKRRRPARPGPTCDRPRNRPTNTRSTPTCNRPTCNRPGNGPCNRPSNTCNRIPPACGTCPTPTTTANAGTIPLGGPCCKYSFRRTFLHF